jgi:hypothetical protein
MLTFGGKLWVILTIYVYSGQVNEWFKNCEVVGVQRFVLKWVMGILEACESISADVLLFLHYLTNPEYLITDWFN